MLPRAPLAGAFHHADLRTAPVVALAAAASFLAGRECPSFRVFKFTARLDLIFDRIHEIQGQNRKETGPFPSRLVTFVGREIGQ